MLNVLIVARYHNSTQSQKLELLSKQSGLRAHLVYPRAWQSELAVKRTTDFGAVSATPITMLGKPNDPHRAMYKSLSFMINRFHPDIIHAEEEPDSIPALQIAIARRIFAPRAKLLFTTWQNINRPMKSYVRLVMQMALAASDGVCCANFEAMSILKENGYNKPTYLLLPTGVDTSLFTPRAHSDAQTMFIIGYVGRLVPEKGIDLLIEAIRELQESPANRPVTLLIMGDGTERNRLKQLVIDAHLEGVIEFLDAGSPQQVASFMQRLDVLVLPSRTTPVWKEQFGRVLVEAMASKVVVLGARSGAIPEVIADAGLLFDEGSSTQLATQLRRLIASPALQADLSERGYARVMEHYTQERIVEQTVTLYRRVTS